MLASSCCRERYVALFVAATNTTLTGTSINDVEHILCVRVSCWRLPLRPPPAGLTWIHMLKMVPKNVYVHGTTICAVEHFRLWNDVARYTTLCISLPGCEERVCTRTRGTFIKYVCPALWKQLLASHVLRQARSTARVAVRMLTCRPSCARTLPGRSAHIYAHMLTLKAYYPFLVRLIIISGPSM